MPDHQALPSTRRRFLVAGGATAGALLVPGTALARTDTGRTVRHQHGRLPIKAIERILGLGGSVSSGVLSLGVDRKDIGDVHGPLGVVFKPSFEISGDLTFQPLGSNLAFFNGDLALRASELNPVVDAIEANGLTFQAMHQHYFDLRPMVWFIHFRGLGTPLGLACAVRKVLDVTATPLPQKPPANPTTPLDHAKLARILHGSAEVGDDGVVTVTISRSDRIVIDDVLVSPEANVSTNVSFLPLDGHRGLVAAAPDFSMRADEIGPVCRTMRAAGFEIGCLYNQETDEQPQLYFAHMIARGAPETLAAAIRRGLDHTRSD